MSPCKFQVIEGGRDKARHAIRRSVHAMFVTHDRGIQAAARSNGLSYNEAVWMILDEERALSAEREKRAYQAGRMSLWTPPGQRQAVAA